jgi:hypothetical protein
MQQREEGTVGGSRGSQDIDVTRTENRQVINMWWQLYERERDRLARISTAAVRAGIEDRRNRIAERGIDLLEHALNATLAELGLDPHDAHVRQVVGSRLRATLEAGISSTAGAPVVIDEEPFVSTERYHEADLGDLRPVDF